MSKFPKFVQITSTSQRVTDSNYVGGEYDEVVVHALDEQGQVWRYDAPTWHPLSVRQVL